MDLTHEESVYIRALLKLEIARLEQSIENMVALNIDARPMQRELSIVQGAYIKLKEQK